MPHSSGSGEQIFGADEQFCFPPKFSFFISDPLNVAELGFFLLLTVIASKAIAVVTKDDRVTRRPKWPLIGWWRRRKIA